ncbi:MAG: M48 family metalloprotease [Verrucomicrobia bacterium]|nr:M48 family metalloprotease [Verrucomicrobiota bacterium]
MHQSPDHPAERPLGSAAKTVLVLSASAVILLCYVSYVVAMLLLALLLACEAVLLVAGARFGLAGFMGSIMRRHAPLLGILFRSFWLNQGTDYRLTIQRAEAPKLFALLENLSARLKIAPPHEVSIEMNSGAWVRLPGYRRGAGRTILGIGYDLLAGLSVSEVEAVMAHEMTHAKLVRRGLKHWLNAGLARTVRVASGLAEVVDAYRRAKVDFTVATALLHGAGALAGLAAGLVAKYSRQDEFEADRGAAELCGANPLRTSLQRLEAMQEKLARLPWPERVAQLQLDESFSRWLVRELALQPPDPAHEAPPEARDPFSTHPSLRDRIAALPAVTATARDDTPAIGLLAEPDRIADQLIAEIQRVLADQEQKDTRSLAKWLDKTQKSSGTDIRWQQLPGFVLVPAGVLVGIAGLLDRVSWPTETLALAMIAGGVWAWRLGRYRDRARLPVPAFAALKRAWQADAAKDLADREKQLEEDLKGQIAAERKQHRQITLLLTDGYAALAQCDYLRAHVAMRLVLARHHKSVEAALGMAVAAAGLHLHDQMGAMLQFLQKQTGFATPATCWGAAWALTLAGDWSSAEALLWRKHAQEPENPTFLALLAMAQLRRNKLQSAALNAGKAVALAPAETEPAKLLAEILLDAGRLRDAAKLLEPLESAAQTDPELAFLMVRLRLLQRAFDAARTWSAALRAATTSAQWLVRLVEAFATARSDEDATRSFNDALAAGFYPEAHLALARLASARRDKATARTHLAASLDLEKTVGEKGAGPLPLFNVILGAVVMLEEPRAGCRAWIATFPNGPAPATPAPLAKRSLLVHAPDQAAAEGYADVILSALQPARPPARASTLFWQPAPKDQQPVRPVRPGVVCVL